MIKTHHFKQREKERGCKFKVKRIKSRIPLTSEDAIKKEAGLPYDSFIETDTCNAVASGNVLLTVYPRKDVRD